MQAMEYDLRELGPPNPVWSFAWVLPSPDTETASSGESVVWAPKTHVKDIQSVNKSEICSPQGPTLGGGAAAARMRNCIHFFYFRCFFASFFDEKIKDPYNDVRSAALEVVANNWKSIYSAEICCFQIFHRFATKYLKAKQCWDGSPSNLSPRRAREPS